MSDLIGISSLVQGTGGALGGIAGGIAGIVDAVNNQKRWKESFEYQKTENELMREREDNAVQRRAADLQSAGINPMIAGLGQGAQAGLGQVINPMQDSTASQSIMAGADLAQRSLSQMVNDKNSTKLTKKQIDKIDKEVDVYNQQISKYMEEIDNIAEMTKTQKEETKIKMQELKDITNRVAAMQGNFHKIGFEQLNGYALQIKDIAENVKLTQQKSVIAGIRNVLSPLVSLPFVGDRIKNTLDFLSGY